MQHLLSIKLEDVKEVLIERIKAKDTDSVDDRREILQEDLETELLIYKDELSAQEEKRIKIEEALSRPNFIRNGLAALDIHDCEELHGEMCKVQPNPSVVEDKIRRDLDIDLVLRMSDAIKEEESKRKKEQEEIEKKEAAILVKLEKLGLSKEELKQILSS